MVDRHLEDNQIHLGHRKRMRAKFAAYGAEIFDTYEILEMLLYSVIPCKDTNPVAKRLLYAFGSLEGVFSASEEELMSVQGVGESVAGLITRTADLPAQLKLECESGDRAFEGFSDIESFFINHYKDCLEYKVSVLYLDNSMQPLDLCDIYDTDFDSSVVRSRDFIDRAIKARASVAVIAHNHPFGPPLPSPTDRTVNKEIEAGLSEIGVNLIEHYVVCGDQAVGIMDNFARRLNLKTSLRSQFATVGAPYNKADGISRVEEVYYAEDDAAVLLGGLIEPVTRGEGRAIADRLLSRFGTLEYILQSSIDELTEEAGEAAAAQIKILAAIMSRRVTDGYKPWQIYTSDQILDYLKALYLYEPVEVVYLISLDKASAFIACDKVASGTVNYSEIIPRKMLEIAKKRGAKSVIIAHNHPRGRANPSDEDMELTCIMTRVFENSQIRLEDHYIISGQRSYSVKLGAPR